MLDSAPPLVSVGLPVYNGGWQLQRALESLVKQSYANLEIIISDNASSDETESICRDYAARDSRIRYHRSQSNLGVEKNFDNALYLATGEYFMWAAHDDMWHHDFVRSNLEQLLRNPDVIASMSKAAMLKGDEVITMPRGFHLGTYALNNSMEKNLIKYVSDFGLNSRVYALFRRNVLLQCRPQDDYCASDFTFVVRTLAFGKYAEINETMFFRAMDGHSWDLIESFSKGQRTALERWFPVWRFTKDILRMKHVHVNLGLILALLRTNIFHAWLLAQAKSRKTRFGTSRITIKEGEWIPIVTAAVDE